MLKANKILGDGIKLGKYYMENKVSKRINRKIVSTIVASKYQGYGVESSDDFSMAVTLYINGVSIGLGFLSHT
jgi:hypothetical protein